MKRRHEKKIGIIAVIAIAAVAAYNVYLSQNDVKLSDLVLANVEALAVNNEYPSSPNPWSKCKGGPYMCYMGQGNVWGKN